MNPRTHVKDVTLAQASGNIDDDDVMAGLLDVLESTIHRAELSNSGPLPDWDEYNARVVA